MLKGSSWLPAALTCFSIVTVGGIVSKSDSKDLEKKDNIPAQSIDRDYTSGYEDSYGHGGHGLTAHSSYGFSEGYEGYGGYESIKHHGHHHHEDHHHHHHHSHSKNYDFHKALAIKGLLVPLAGVALLGAAAAFVSNPILLQLGVISSPTFGRKKREANGTDISPKDQIRLNELKLLERFMAQIPKQEIEAQEKKMLANYLSCSGVTTTNLCLERLACELHSPEGVSMPMEASILSIVVNEILGNDFIPKGTKTRILNAVKRGKKELDCGVYECEKLEEEREDVLETKRQF